MFLQITVYIMSISNFDEFRASSSLSKEIQMLEKFHSPYLCLRKYDSSEVNIYKDETQRWYSIAGDKKLRRFN